MWGKVMYQKEYTHWDLFWDAIASLLLAAIFLGMLFLPIIFE